MAGAAQRATDSAGDVVRGLEERQRAEVQAVLSRAARIVWLPALGFALALPGLIASLPWIHERGGLVRVLVLTFGAAAFGAILLSWATWPFRVKARIAPYFARELGPYGGPTRIAVRRGRALRREIAALDERARSLGVRPLSDFGFEDDLQGEAVRWHPAAEGLATVDALRAEPGTTAADLAQDLDVLASLLRLAADRGVAFSLVLRLENDDGQGALYECEMRQGHFW